jgi:hypothetical protein
MPAPHPSWPGTGYGPVIEVGYPYEVGPEYRYDSAHYDTDGRYGPWPVWRRVDCEVITASIVRGTTSPAGRLSSATAALELRATTAELSPWHRDAAGERPNRANLPLRVSITDGATVWPLFTGWVDQWADTDLAHEPGRVTIVASDGLKQLANLDQGELAPQGAGEAAGARISRILDRAGWADIAGRDLSPGTIALQATTLASPALEEIYLTADTEAGHVWIDTRGTFRFVDRDWMVSAAARPPWHIGDRTIDSAAVCASSIVTVADHEDVQNVIGISRIGGTASWLEDAASIKKYGRHSWSRFDLPYASELDTGTILAVQLADRTAREYRVASVLLAPLGEPPAWPITLGVELFDTVFLTRTRGADRLEESASVIGIDHTLGPGEVVTMLSLGPRLRFPGAVYDTARYDIDHYVGA